MERTRPYIVSSVAMSLDGCIDDSSKERLVLSSEADLAEIDRLRAELDAILVGAGTLRSDNPKLTVKSYVFREQRVLGGRSADPLKITLTSEGDLDPEWKFFTTGECEKFVYCPFEKAESLSARIGSLAKVVYFPGAKIDPEYLLEDLWKRGVKSLLVEGGEAVHSLFLQAGLVDEFRVAIAPFFVGEEKAPKFAIGEIRKYLYTSRLELTSTERYGETAVLKYRAVPSPAADSRDRECLQLALDQSKNCGPVDWYGVGCVITAADGGVISTGYTGERKDNEGHNRHAEDIALEKAKEQAAYFPGATLYSTLEPCSVRSSGKTPCCHKILLSGIRRVVYGAKEPFEPELGVDCQGDEVLRAAGIVVIQIKELEGRCLAEIVSHRRSE